MGICSLLEEQKEDIPNFQHTLDFFSSYELRGQRLAGKVVDVKIDSQNETGAYIIRRDEYDSVTGNRKDYVIVGVVARGKGKTTGKIPITTNLALPGKNPLALHDYTKILQVYSEGRSVGVLVQSDFAVKEYKFTM